MIYQYRSKYFSDIIVTAIRYRSFNSTQEQELIKLFNNYPYSYEDTYISNHKTKRQVGFYDGVRNKEIKVFDGDWIICFDEETFSTLDHNTFKDRFEFFSSLTS